MPRRPRPPGCARCLDPIEPAPSTSSTACPQYAVSIAAERGGEVVAGVVLDAAPAPSTSGTSPAGTEPADATRDGDPARSREPAPIAPAPGRHRLQLRPSVRARSRPRPWPGCCRWSATSGGSASCALDLCGAVGGSLDGYFEEGVNLWDHAAGGLIARIAGARLEIVAGVADGPRLVVLCAPPTGSTSSFEAVRGRLLTRFGGIAAWHSLFTLRVAVPGAFSNVHGA